MIREGGAGCSDPAPPAGTLLVLMDIHPANIAQVLKAQGGGYITIDDDVVGIASDLRALDPTLHLRYSEAGQYFVVFQTLETGEEHLVLTAQELDPRIVGRVQQVMRPDYDYAAELERQDEETNLVIRERFEEQVGEIGERLYHAVRKDKGL